MKLCPIKWETKAYNSPLPADISAKIISHALITTVSLYWVVTCIPSITRTEDAGESHIANQIQILGSAAGRKGVCLEFQLQSSWLRLKSLLKLWRMSFPHALIKLSYFYSYYFGGGNPRCVLRSTQMILLWDQSCLPSHGGLSSLILLWWGFFFYVGSDVTRKNVS